MNIPAQRFRNSVGYLWLIVAAGYLAISAGQSVVRNYHSQQDIQGLQHELADLQLEQQRLNALNVYYETDAYKEKQLREDLLMIKPGERVYALPESGNVKSLEDEVLKPTTPDLPQKQVDPYWQQWVNYLF